MTVWLYLLAAIGATQIICYGKILTRFRQSMRASHEWLGELVHCPQCCGFWVGFFLSPTINDYLGMAFMYGCAVSLLSYLTAMVVDDDGVRLKIKH